ncbi:Dynactin subunit 3 [Balamuthia mandrillaris]
MEATPGKGFSDRDLEALFQRVEALETQTFGRTKPHVSPYTSSVTQTSENASASSSSGGGRTEAEEGGGSSSTPLRPPRNIFEDLEQIQRELTRLEKHAPNFNNFFAKYKHFCEVSSGYLGEGVVNDSEEEGSSIRRRKSAATRTKPTSMVGGDLLSKAAIVLAYESEARKHAELAQSFTAATDILDNDNLQTVPSLLPRLKQLEAVHLDQVEASAILNERFEQLLNTYNDTINLVSMQFVVWDQTLLKLEKEKEKAESQQK